MKNEKYPLESQAQKVIESTLREIPFLRSRVLNDKSAGPSYLRPDLVYKLKAGDQTKTLFVEFKNSGQPRYARDAVNNLLRLLNKDPGSYGVFVAPYISTMSAQICNEAGVGYLDFAGNVNITFDHVFINRTGIPNPQAEKRFIKSLYSQRAERVLRVLLNDGNRRWKLRGLGSSADVSIGHVSNVKKLLVDREWIKKDPEGWYITNQGELLAEWAKNYRPDRNQATGFYSPLSPTEIEIRLEEYLKQSDMKFGFTGFSAAARYSPAVMYKKTTMYIEKITDDLVSAAGLKLVPSGANVDLVIPYDEGVFYWARPRRNITVVSAIQVYLDLVRDRGRGEEAAQALRDYIWTNVWHKSPNDNKTGLQ